MEPSVSVILIRENAEQLTGSGCCGKLEGDGTLLGHGREFDHARADQRSHGLLHRTLREFFPPREGRPQVAVVTVDPRNQLYLISKLWRDVWRYRPGLRSGLITLLQLFSLPAVIVNGRVISRRGRALAPDDLLREVECRLATTIPADQTAGPMRP